MFGKVIINVHVHSLLMLLSCRVCYCFHPSYTELKNIVRYLCPRRVVASVIPINHTREEVRLLYVALTIFKPFNPIIIISHQKELNYEYILSVMENLLNGVNVHAREICFIRCSKGWIAFLRLA